MSTWSVTGQSGRCSCRRNSGTDTALASVPVERVHFARDIRLKVNLLLQSAVACADNFEHARAHPYEVLTLEPGQLEIYVALYKFCFYRGRLDEAEQIALAAMIIDSAYLTETFSIADAALFYVEFRADKIKFTMPAKLLHHYQHLLQRPGIRQVLMEEGYPVAA
jgi:hypothetical protein